MGIDMEALRRMRIARAQSRPLFTHAFRAADGGARV